MAFRASFDCLWCGRRHAAADEDDLAGWAHLCPACLERAGTNPFLRYRLRRAIADRRAARGGPSAETEAARREVPSGPGSRDDEARQSGDQAG